MSKHLSAVADVKIMSVQGWFSRLLAEWRQSWDMASNEARAHATASLDFLGPPAQVRIYVHLSASKPVQANIVEIRHDPSEPDGDLCVLVVDETDILRGDAPEDKWIVDLLREEWTNMQANWSPEHPPDPPPKSWQIFKRQEGESVIWFIGGELSQVDTSSLVEDAFHAPHEQTTSSVIGSEPPPKHLYRLHEDRETESMIRWLRLQTHARALFDAFEIRGFWWCGLFLPRQLVFDDRHLDGDVDIIGGPLELTVTRGEWDERINRVANKHPLETPRYVIQDLTAKQVASEGAVEWPPKLDTIIGCEVKASWYQAENALWKASHIQGGRRIRGQLEVLWKRGFDRVGFLHLGSTSPREETHINPWFQASVDLKEGREQFPKVFPPEELPASFGYFSAITGAVRFATEDMSGAGEALHIHQPPQINPQAQDCKRAWMRQLQKTLGTSPMPRWPVVYVYLCKRCGLLKSSPHPQMNCIDC